MARPDLGGVAPTADPPASPLEAPAWDSRRALTPAEEDDAWKIARLTATLMAQDGIEGGWPTLEDAVRCGASLLEISRRCVVADADRKGGGA